VLSRRSRLDVGDTVRIDEDGAMDAQEGRGRKAIGSARHGAAHEISVAAGMDLKAASHLKRPQEGAQAAFIGSFDNQIEGVFVSMTASPWMRMPCFFALGRLTGSAAQRRHRDSAADNGPRHADAAQRRAP